MKKIFRSKNKYETFYKHRVHRKGAIPDLLAYSQETLETTNMGEAVVLPKNENLQEWLAIHTVDFFTEVSLLYGTVRECCTNDNCPVMSAGPKFEYLWANEAIHKKPVRLPAPQHIDLLLSWVEDKLEQPRIFPASGRTFPQNFETIVRKIFKLLLRVYAHIYYSHVKKITALGAARHLNTCFKHFVFFMKEFNLVEESEQECLREVIQTLYRRGR